MSWGAGAEEILHAITQSFDFSRCPEEDSIGTEENDLLHQAQERLQSHYYGNVDLHEMILGQEVPGTLTDDMLDFPQHDLLWLQGSGDTLEACARDMGIYNQPALLECDKEILGQSLMLLPDTAVGYKEEEMLL